MAEKIATEEFFLNFEIIYNNKKKVFITEKRY